MYPLKKHHKKHIHKKLYFRLQLYFFISLVMIAVVLFELFSGRVSLLLAGAGLLVGVGIGVVLARMFLLSFDKNAKKVISRLDLFGGLILFSYVIFALFRRQIIGDFVQASFVTGTSLSMVAGIMIGRVFGTGQRIIRILRAEKVITD